jgi:hypothetical protein
MDRVRRNGFNRVNAGERDEGMKEGRKGERGGVKSKSIVKQSTSFACKGLESRASCSLE